VERGGVGFWAYPDLPDWNVRERVVGLSPSVYASAITALGIVVLLAYSVRSLRRLAEARRQLEDLDRGYETRLLMETLRARAPAVGEREADDAERPNRAGAAVGGKVADLIAALNAHEDGPPELPVEDVTDQETELPIRFGRPQLSIVRGG
jgi:hypothetical protein